MNKIYRRLWSSARQCWVVASELTAAKGKASRTVGMAAATGLLAAMPVVSAAETEDEAEEERQLQLHELRSIAEPIALARLLSSGTAVASAPLGTYRQLAVVTDNYYFDASVAGDEQLILGSRAGINGSKSVVYGNVAYASGTRSTALGYSSKAYTSYATAVGATAVADGVGTVALGNSANAYEKNSIAIGSGSMAFGENGYSRIAIGGNSRAGTNGWTGAIALGGESKAEFDAIALGHGAKASQEGAIAVGRGASASGVGSVALGKDAVATESYTLSVGSASRKRRIVNVDDARLSTTSADAVTGKQLHSTNQSVAIATSTANAAKATADQALINSGIVTQAGVGGMIRVGGENTGTVLSISNKNGATRYLNGIRNGTLNSSSTDAVTGQQLYATNANVSAVKSIADGASTKADVVAGLVSQDASTHALRLGAENIGLLMDVRSKDGASRKVTGVADGVLGVASSEAVNGKQLHTTDTNVTAARTAADTAQRAADAVKVTADEALGGVTHLRGLVSEVASDGNVRLGRDNSGAVLDVRNRSNGTRRLTGLSDGALGSASTEAVTGRQLHATNQLVDTQGQALLAHGQTLTAHGQQLVLQDRRIGENRTDLDALRAAFEDFDPDLEDVVRFSADGSVDLGGGKVRGLAAGDISSAASTEAVNGGQLFATNGRVSAIEEQSQFVRIGVGGRRLPAQAGLVSVAIGDGAEATQTSEGGVALGAYASAQGKNSVAIGRAAVVGEMADQSFALGTQSEAYGSSSMAFGAAARAMAGADMSVAIGNESIASQANSVSFGNDLLKRRLMNVGRGTSDNEVTTFEQLSEAVSGLGGGASVGSIGEFIAPSYMIQGSVYSNVGDALAVLDSAVMATNGHASMVEQRFNSVFGAGISHHASGSSVLELTGAGGVVVSNLADGRVSAGSRDAVTGGQLFEADRQINQNREDLNELREMGRAQAWFVNSISFDAGVIDYNGARLTGLSEGVLGEASTDAVTGRQLYSATQLVASQGQMLNVHGQELGLHDRRIGDNRADLDELRADFEDFDPNLEGVVRFAVDGSVDMGGGKVREIAAGDVSSASSTEAVNGGQLFATNARVSGLEAFGRFFKIGTDNESQESRAGWFGVAIGESSEATPVGGTEGGTAVGSFSKAFGTNSVALGRAAHVSEDATDGFSLGASSHVRSRGGVALGASARVMPGADMAVAVGYNAFADEAYTVSFGARDFTRRLLNISAGRGDADAVNMGQARSLASMLGSGAGFDSEGRAVAPSYLIQGSLHSNPGDALSALDSTVTNTSTRVSNVEAHLSSIFASAPTTKTNGIPQLTLAGAQGMVLSNVANGLVAAGSRDAVNGGQLHAVQQQLNGRMDGLEQRVDGQSQTRVSRMATTDETAADSTPQADSPQVTSTADAPTPPPTAAPTPKADARENVKPQVDTADLERMLARANEYSDGISREVDARLDKMDKRFNRMAAMNSAQAAMAMNTAGLATYNRLGAGVGYSDGESAMAVGYQRVLNDKGSATFSLNGAFTNSGERSMGVGVGIGW